MSLDFPNREDWLAYRMKIKKPLRYIHVSGYGRAARRAMINGMEIPAGSTYVRLRKRT